MRLRHTPFSSNKDLYCDDICVGIEIEAEGYDNDAAREFVNHDDGEYWEVKGDGSLRDRGVEYCSRILLGQEITNALSKVSPSLGRCNINWRAGIHVHVDVRPYNHLQIANIAALYAMLEPLIFAWEGNNRDQSNFCVPWSVCPDPAETLADCVRTIEALDNPDRRSIRAMYRRLVDLGKYSALNLVPITHLGSIEFRLMESTADVNRILDFVNICMAIVKIGAETYETGVVTLLSALGPESFFRNILGGLPNLTSVPEASRLIWQGVSTANILTSIGTVQLPHDSLESLPII